MLMKLTPGDWDHCISPFKISELIFVDDKIKAILLFKTSFTWHHSQYKLGVNFTNVLQTAFTCADPKGAQRQSSHQCPFTLLESARVKAARKTLVKLTPDHQLSLKTLLLKSKQ